MASGTKVLNYCLHMCKVCLAGSLITTIRNYNESKGTERLTAKQHPVDKYEQTFLQLLCKFHHACTCYLVALLLCLNTIDKNSERLLSSWSKSILCDFKVHNNARQIKAFIINNTL